MPYNRIIQDLKPYLALCRVWISLFAACSAATGYVLASYHSLGGLLIPAAAIFLLACGASALNQFQEQDIDAKMERTRERPLPSGRITPAQALSFALAMIVAGQTLLFFGQGMGASVLGFIAIAWYNGIYTYSKRVTAFASVPGTAVGMIPPAIGWISAGGEIVDLRLASICLIFFLWQVPHFWLLVLSHGEDYERAGLPSLTRVMSGTQIARITFVWIVAAAIAGLALPLYGSVRSPLVYCSFILSALWLVWNGRSLTGHHPSLFSVPILFRKINIYLFLIMSLLSLENIFLRMP